MYKKEQENRYFILSLKQHEQTSLNLSNSTASDRIWSDLKKITIPTFVNKQVLTITCISIKLMTQVGT